MDNEKLAKELEACQSNEEILKVLADNGINVTAEEVDALVKKAQAQESGELGEDALEDVAGGGAVLNLLTRSIVISVIAPRWLHW